MFPRNIKKDRIKFIKISMNFYEMSLEELYQRSDEHPFCVVRGKPSKKFSSRKKAKGLLLFKVVSQLGN